MFDLLRVQIGNSLYDGYKLLLQGIPLIGYIFLEVKQFWSNLANVLIKFIGSGLWFGCQLREDVLL